MSKHSKTMPHGEARPLGTKVPKRTNKPVSKDAALFKKVVDTPSTTHVDSVQTSSDAAMTPTSSQTNAAQERTHMATITLTLDPKVRKSTSLVYNSPSIKGGVRIAKSAFTDGVAPATLDISADTFAAPKVAETKEQRKARLAAAPKLTLAEKIAKREKQLDAMRAKAALQTSPVVEAAGV